MGSGETQPEAGDGDPLDSSSPTAAGGVAEKTCFTRIGALRPLPLEGLVKLGGSTAEDLLDQGIALPRTVFKHTRRAASETGRRFGI